MPTKLEDKNVLGGRLIPCGTDPMTGFFRDGSCSTCKEDRGSHTVCAEMTAEFLEVSKRQGNDLSTPNPEFGFPGLRPGDRWCLCAGRWKEALALGVAPPIVLAATHARALEVLTIDELFAHAVDSNWIALADAARAVCNPPMPPPPSALLLAAAAVGSSLAGCKDSAKRTEPAAEPAIGALTSSGEVEAKLLLERLKKRTSEAFATDAAFPIGIATLTPATACCQQPDGKCPPSPADWAKPLWQALELQLDEPHTFQYSYQGRADQLLVTALGDPGCKGRPIKLILAGRVTDGVPTYTITRSQ